jgi:Coenzyme PQQ synthesis protein D (PqqD)
MAAAISLDSIVVASKNQVSCPLEDEVAIVQVKAGVYYGLDPVGARVWELIRTPRSVRSVRDTLLAEYQVGAEQCETDLVALLQSLDEAGLIEVAYGKPR